MLSFAPYGHPKEERFFTPSARSCYRGVGLSAFPTHFFRVQTTLRDPARKPESPKRCQWRGRDASFSRFLKTAKPSRARNGQENRKEISRIALRFGEGVDPTQRTHPGGGCYFALSFD